MGWDRVLTDLLDLFVGLYPTPADAMGVARRAGLPLKFLDFGGSALNFWGAILDQANLREKVPDLIDVAHQDYPNIDFPALSRRKDVLAPPAPKLDKDHWKTTRSDLSDLEKVMGAQPTFLPISFLEVGVGRARSVARVVGPTGLGTGFLARGNLLITNHHVIPDEATARRAKIQFNYQQTAGGLSAAAEEFDLAPDEGFATSPMTGGDDWTAVRVARHPVLGPPAARWGELELPDAEVRAGDFVNIIQHPSGMPKQIALYHNVVTYADDSLVQYLTDTLPGSSGSPVFDSGWRVVALHHSGGMIPEPGTKQVLFRNEGISVRALLRGLNASGLLSIQTI